MRTGSYSQQIHDHWASLLNEGFEELIHPMWERGLQGIGNLGVMLERGWRTLGNHWYRDPSLMSPAHRRLDDWLTGLTWGPAANAAHAKAQPNAQLTALVEATQRLYLDRWDAYWEKGLNVRGAAGRRLIDHLVEQRFGVVAGFASSSPYWKMPSPELAAALDERLDRVVDRRPSFPDVSIEVLGLSQDPVFGPSARHHVRRWVNELRHAGRVERAVTAARHGLVMQSMGDRADPPWVTELFLAWLGQGVTPTITLRSEDMDNRRGIKHRFSSGHLQVAYDPVRSQSGTHPQNRSFSANFSEVVNARSYQDQTLNVAEHWFAGWVTGTPMPAALTPVQRDACLAVWRNQAEIPQLLEAMESLPVDATARPARARL